MSWQLLRPLMVAWSLSAVAVGLLGIQFSVPLPGVLVVSVFRFVESGAMNASRDAQRMFHIQAEEAR